MLVKKCAQKKRTMLMAAATVCTLAVIPTLDPLFVPSVLYSDTPYSDYSYPLTLIIRTPFLILHTLTCDHAYP